MAFDNANISADEVTWAAADIPMLIGRNWLRYPGAEARWRTVNGEWGADASHANGPAAYGYDDHDHHKTYASGTANHPYYVINLGSGVGVVDSIVLLNPSGMTAATVTVEFCTDQDGLFTPFQTAATQSPSTDKRMVFLDLDHGAVGTAQRYSEVQYMRIHFSGAAILPKFGECIIGRRRQLKLRSKLPDDPRNLKSNVRDLISDTGIRKRHVFAKGIQRINKTLRTHEDARREDLEAFFETEIDYGTLPFFWIAEPNSAPSDALWMSYGDPELIDPKSGYSKRELLLRAIENGPNFLTAGI